MAIAVATAGLIGGTTPVRAQAVAGAAAAGGWGSPLVLLLAGLAGALALVAGGLAVILIRTQRGRVRMQAAFNAMPWPRQLGRRDGTPLVNNPAFVERFGDRRRALPEVLAEQVDDDGARQELRRLAANAAAGIGGHVEAPVWDPDSGERIWLDVRAQPMPDQDGLVAWLTEDITARRQMQDILRTEMARFVDLLEHAPVGFYSVDGDGRFLFVNKTLTDWLGTTPEKLTDGHIRLHDLIPEAATEGAPAHVPFASEETVHAASGDAVTLGPREVVLVGPTGQRIETYITQEVVGGEDGQPISTRSVVRNLSDERQVHDALERSERRFRRFFQQSPVGIALLDADGRVQECNAAFSKLMGVSRDAVVGQPAQQLVRPGDRAALGQALSRDGGGGRPEVRPAAEPDTVCRVFATPLDAEGAGGARGLEREGHVLHLIDATEQKNLEEQFAQSQKMQAVGQLAGGIAHDFNNLLTAMIGFCDLLLLRHRPGDQSFADLMQVKQNANRAANLVRQLLAFSRQQTLRPTVLSVTDVLQELMHLLRRLIGENIQLDVIHGRSLWEVKVDQGQLEQVIINLAVNARDAMADGGGELAIRTSNQQLSRPLKREGETVPPGDYVLIEVADSGCGIAQENLDRIFEPFFSTKEVGAGTGLGLSTVYGIVKQTGGFILVDSAPGVGTNFQIYLPRHQQIASEHAPTKSGQGQVTDLTGMGTLLLVEDEEAVRAFSARALRKKGYTVLEASSGEHALDVMADQGDQVDLLITDVVMPNLDGPALVKRVRETRPDVKVIFISGYTEDSFRRNLGEEADTHFLGKPFTLKQLAGMVKDVLYADAR
ncbi:hybrid sensor histidine kinase/response regulator [Rhodovibrio salinarum]|uniref:histidine kinase n=1 Tax=Rhodovibrio salinarum TaxID=1087 RepID=A0A934QKJ7_9PROT|nr:PAS domain S-box protein [Rhodovibrio salinarum]MBK1698417.1 hybrid sensor histidine kinase/response regulator [Rhodovibrio salinarum]